MKCNLRIYCCSNPRVNDPKSEEETQPALLSYPLQGLMIKEDLNINNAWSITQYTKLHLKYSCNSLKNKATKCNSG